ncbi:MAG TPA: hypothetical protein VNS34_10495 [Rhizobiaceae bacterium]|nr:hypothetical protein [Rhizobiaceae bacterium]
MNRLTRTPRTSEPITFAGTIQDACALVVVALLVAAAALVLP